MRLILSCAPSYSGWVKALGYGQGREDNSGCKPLHRRLRGQISANRAIQRVGPVAFQRFITRT